MVPLPAAVAVPLALALLAAGLPLAPAEPAPETYGSVALQPIATGLARPLYVTHAGDGSGRLFIVEQAGLVKVWQNGAVCASGSRRRCREAGARPAGPREGTRGLTSKIILSIV